MFEKNREFKFVAAIAIIYLILVELILPPAKFLPSVEILWDTGNTLVRDYHLITELSEFLSWVYLPFFFCLLFFYLLRNGVSRIFLNYGKILDAVKPFFFVPFLFVLFYLQLIIENTIAGEIVFSLFISAGLLKYFIAQKLSSLENTFSLAALGIGAEPRKIYGEVIPRQILPGLKSRILLIHAVLFNSVLIYEAFAGNFTGGIYTELFSYADAAGIVALSLILWIVFGVNHLLLKYVLNKIIFWE